jgi:hypothetical protein
MPSDFWWKNYKFCSIDAYFLILFFKGSKVICQRGKTFFFHQKSEGIAFTFCRYLNQNMRAFKFCRYCLQKYFLIPSNFDEKKYHCILRAIPWEFWDEVFSLKIWGQFIQQCTYLFKFSQFQNVLFYLQIDQKTYELFVRISALA